ncbi:MAG TPA: carbamoyltransferase HypF [Aquifex aeolicus]|uniref:Carbamoyltransferase n=1 Tax=Aquifex aeolicus TaxID=63363 RepID=A0A9D1CF44_AQUAO|nr:carbamoyltransferase HypF [Aquifex aeolicus]
MVYKRAKISLKGLVQGVGFRPFVYRLATALNLKGFVLNDGKGVLIEVEGNENKVALFLKRLHTEKPPNARIISQEFEFLPPKGYKNFEIKGSQRNGEREVLVLPDLATCEDCLTELFNPADRRYMYPFINCTNCGPRFTIIESLPYDRPNTSMKKFKMCPACLREYTDPKSRRFHAQPNACKECGPQLYYWEKGKITTQRDKAFEKLIEELKRGKIVAVKGIGGFHLICNATDEKVVSLLRERKKRREKPFAVMFRDLDQLMEYANPTQLEKALLISPERPIVLVEKRKELAPSVAPKLKKVGAFLPYSPLHHMILRAVDFPVVATSANLSEEPIVKDNEEAISKLKDLADAIVLHDRDIVRRCDDSVVKVVGGVPLYIRRSRGVVPSPILLPFRLKRKVLAVGGTLKNTFAIAWNDKVILSQHIGDIENLSTLKVFEESVKDLMNLYDFVPDLVVCDMHPRYETTRFAKTLPYKVIQMQHHHAHAVSCMAENGLQGEVLAVTWDGTGFGLDKTVWGGEFLISTYTSFRRFFHFKNFKLLGGEKAVKEPARVALSLLFELYGEKVLSLDLPAVKFYNSTERRLLYKVWKVGFNNPLTSSVGRLFDGVASLLGICQKVSYEGEAAMLVEDLYDPSVRDFYDFILEGDQVDWKPIIEGILKDRKDPPKAVSRFINTLARIVLEVALKGEREKVCLSGGVMQNDPLVRKIKELLTKEGFKVYTHQKVPSGDGGISLGQAVFGGLIDL